MKNWLTALPWILLLLSLAYISQCTHRGEATPEIQYKDSLRIDSVWNTIDNTKHYPKPKADTVYFSDTVQLPADTALLIAECKRISFEFNKSKIYNRHLIIDSIGYIDLRDSVTKNELYGFVMKSKFKQLEVIKTDIRTIVTPARNKVLVGLILTGNKEYFGASPSIMFQGKKDNVFLLGYDVINKNYNVGTYVKIRLKK